MNPVVLFGAFDRHNFGDLLFPHIAAAMLPDVEPLFAGLVERDMRALGGHRVRPLAGVPAALATAAALTAGGDRPGATLVHVGGEILTCDAWQAAVMLLPPELVQPTIGRLDAQPAQRIAWARSFLGGTGLAPYVASREGLPGIERVVYLGAGGTGLADCEPALRAEVIAKLSSADEVGVRDRHTLAQLRAAGIAARLMPDPAVMAAELFGDAIRTRSGPAGIAGRFADGYLAVQFSADFGDDDTLDRLAAQLDRLAASTGLGVALFRAGAAPWHDDLGVLRRTAARLRPGSAAVFESLDLWDICALLAGSRGYCGSSLHGRIVATAFGLPRVNLLHPSTRPRRAGVAGGYGGDGDNGGDRCDGGEAPTVGKQAAYAETWELPGLPTVAGVDDVAEAVGEALAADPAALAAHAASLAARYRRTFAEIMGGGT
ncbi:polysaccharide pyruvyl transferase family protein [Burkholderiaceae bacterium FT117]|uniref:polysaccharide pyruvyl transferase family protein n=1 Tax=Zeimonas sediminis TaxID=2944268 RepID=UPI002342DE0C|nr:polysaccharide pyruvyl transferase family protein [Zeimonas sediminis]MCM5571142.1 polysaccharide pyruvyl transferase family protein [Zeimonas sediminis]